MPDWKQYEGEIAGGRFPLDRYLGGLEPGAVFRTRSAHGRAAIRLVPAEGEQAGELIERWNRASALRHPHLAGILEAGACSLGGLPLAYLVTEYADENLAEVLPERPLTPDEARAMLLAAAEALAYLHGQGLAHGNLKPSEVLAIEDTVKLSCDTVSAGEAAEDIRALGATLVESLTQRRPPAGGTAPELDAVPPPFDGIARNCLRQDPALRWPAATIAAALRPQAPPATAPPATKFMARPGVRAGAVLLAAAAVLAVALAVRRTGAPAPPAEPAASQAPKSTSAAPALDGRKAAPKPSPLPRDGRVRVPGIVTPQPAPGLPAPEAEITRRVLPDIPAKARATVRGTATVVVRVTVDPAGNVTAAGLESTVSKYFGTLALQAARQWKFAAVEGGEPRSWILRFDIRRTATAVVPRKSAR